MTTERIATGLASQFEKHRIVFWYDAEHSFRDTFEAVSIPSVEKVEIANNEFGLKHRILREAPKQKFLLYKGGPEPDRIENWLLDVQLANGEFRMDQVSNWLSELDLGISFSDLVRKHEEFFRAAKRIEQFKRLLRPDDTASALRLKMLAVCANADPTFDAVTENLLAENAEKRDDRLRLITRVALDEFLWEQIGRHFGYRAKDPSVPDFAIELFKSCYAFGVGSDARLSSEALVFFRRWKNNRNAAESFETLSGEYEQALAIPADLARRDFRTLVELDYFREIDREIIRNLVREIGAQTVPHADVVSWIRQRRQSHWYQEFADLYQALGHAADFLQSVAQATLNMESLSDGARRYAQSWFRIDQLYRQFVFHMQRSAQASLMGDLFERIENLYVNTYLLKLNDRWQEHIDAADLWEAPPIMRQREFYAAQVAPYRRKDLKLCVVISDAMRYEVAEELLGRIRSLDRYDAEIEPALASLPSYTQLGMASLLPNKEIRIANDDTGIVLVDGASSQGLVNRRKILENGRAGDRVAALKAEEVMAMKGDEARALLRDHDVVYMYHNRIDAAGDKMVSEERVFEAVEDSLDELVKLVKKLTAANASNLLLTGDHGFIYQHRPIEESDFSGAEVTGDSVLFKDRRFVLGKGLVAQSGLRKFEPAALGLEGDVEVLIPKSINRLRLKGSGSRYVHGGASLQEVIIPVLKINKKRQSDLSAVEVDIVASSNKSITSAQISVLFYQSTPVTEKAQPRRLRAGIYSGAGELISDSHDLLFDFPSENPREREMPIRFLLSKKADNFNGQEVVLKLEEQHAGTSHFKEYRSMRYLLRRSFTSDFDF
ncbi:MAG: BREX-1 system phosphatase PglZ type A [Mesorhizobium sp.]|nr:MAG: BREX-1 system phosphatase PglZ type A [Mesorhizobium sp.]